MFLLFYSCKYTILYFCWRRDSVLLLHKKERIKIIRDQGGQIVSVRHQQFVSFWPLSINTVLSWLTHNQCSNDKGGHNNAVFMELKVGHTPALWPLLRGEAISSGHLPLQLFMLMWSIVCSASTHFRFAGQQGSGCRTFN